MSSTYAPRQSDEGAGFVWAVAVLLGILVAVLGFFAQRGRTSSQAFSYSSLS